MGAVWPRTNTPRGSINPQAWKLSVVLSFSIAVTILRSTFLATLYLYYCHL